MAASLVVRGPIRPLHVLSILCGLMLVKYVVWADIEPGEYVTGNNRSRTSPTRSVSAPVKSFGGIRHVQAPVQGVLGDSRLNDLPGRFSRGLARSVRSLTEMYEFCIYTGIQPSNGPGINECIQFEGMDWNRTKSQWTGWKSIDDPSLKRYSKNARDCLRLQLPSVGPVVGWMEPAVGPTDE
ncbi:uncharacterized protein LOC143277305 [Babylonia areolata]|uniref:uncharacterized protein LOC143277305 n=1 Tax=Babylonia areolata TaxID=304850 RepID=UPI003FD1A8C5